MVFYFLMLIGFSGQSQIVAMTDNAGCLLTGTVYDAESREPLNAKVIVESLPKSGVADTLYTNSTGGFRINLKTSLVYHIEVHSDFYLIQSEKIEVPDSMSDKEIHREIFLSKIYVVTDIRPGPVFFEQDKYNLTEKSSKVTANYAEMFQGLNIKIVLEGHCDSIEAKNNASLSIKRARIVRKQLISCGMIRNQIQIEGMKDTHPMYPNNTPEGRSMNRRVEIKIMEEKK